MLTNIKLRIRADHHSELARTFMGIQHNLATCYRLLGLQAEALSAKRECYALTLECWGPRHEQTFIVANNLLNSLADGGLYEEVRKLGQELLPVAMSAFGPGHLQTLNTRKNTAHGFMNDPAYCDRAGLIEAEATLADVARKFQRLLGPSHPDTKVAEASAAAARHRVRRLFGGAAP